MDVSIDLSGVTLTTERLILRPWRESDAEDLYAYASVPGVGEMAGWAHHTSLAESEKVIASFIAGKDVLALESRASGRVIGSLGLHSSFANDDPEYASLTQKEVGYVLAREMWGQGLAAEAVRVVIGYAFGTLDLDALAVGHFVSNTRSRGVIEKCGFTYIGDCVYNARQIEQSIPARKYMLFNTRLGVKPRSPSDSVDGI